MLDIDFLKNFQRPKSFFVYRYRTGIFRNKVKRALLDDLPNPDVVADVRESNFNSILHLSNPDFIDELIFCDVGQAEKRKWTETDTSRLLDALLCNAAKRPIVFIPLSSHFLDCSEWGKVREVGTVVDEIEVTAGTLVDALRFLETTTDLAQHPAFTSQEGFVESFIPLLDDEPDILTLMHEFDGRVLTCTDPVTNVFDNLQQQAEAGHFGRGSLLRQLRAFVLSRDGWDLISLVTTFDERRFKRGWTGIEIVRALYRMTAKILTDSIQGHIANDGVLNHAEPRAAPSKSEISACLWAIVLLAWESRLLAAVVVEDDWLRPTCSHLTYVVDQIGRDFLKRSKFSHRSDPSQDLAPALSQTFSRFAREESSLDSARKKLFASLLSVTLSWTESGHFPWITSFRQRLASRVRVAGFVQNEGDKHEVKLPQNDPRSFDEVVGHRELLDGLRLRLQINRQGTGLIFHGPKGVGKRTIGRLYAKSLLCLAPASSGLACDECSNCEEFAKGGQPLGFISIETKEDKQTKQSFYAAEKAGQGSIAFKRATLLTNIETYTPDDADTLLKTIENGEVPFVITTCDLSKARLAVVSRSNVFKLRKLTWEEVREQLKRKLLILNIDCDERVIDLLVGYSEGLPGRIIKGCEIVAALSDRNLEAIRSALGWQWIHSASVYWINVFGGGNAEETPTFKLDHADCDLTFRQLQAFLFHVRLFISGPDRLQPPVCDPEFIMCDHRMFANTADLLLRRAEKLKQTPEDLWCKLVGVWTNPDIAYDDKKQMFDRSQRCVLRSIRSDPETV